MLRAIIATVVSLEGLDRVSVLSIKETIDIVTSESVSVLTIDDKALRESSWTTSLDSSLFPIVIILVAIILVIVNKFG